MLDGLTRALNIVAELGNLATGVFDQVSCLDQQLAILGRH